jgi:multisubunit Na+/H+ antiporter MnhC subunit
MAVIAASGSLNPGSFGVKAPGMAVANLSTTQAGNGPSTNVVDRGGSIGPVLLRLTTAAGATPTCTYAVEGSPDNVNFFAVQYADSASPQTLVITTFVISSAVTVLKLIPSAIPVRYLRVTYSVNTNVTNTLDAFIY